MVQGLLTLKTDFFVAIKTRNDLRKTNKYENKIIVGITEYVYFTLLLYKILPLNVKKQPL